jgi:hypothetical protein
MNRNTPARRLTAAAMDLAAIRPWHEITWREIAAAAGLTLDTAQELAPSKAAILDLLSRQADQAILAAPAAAGDGSARDRLFDVAMRRFDALKPYRKGLASVAASAAREPATALAALCSVGRASRALLIAAAIPTEGVAGTLRAKGMSAIWLAAMRSFLADETEDLSATMATLDKQLRRAEGLLGRLTPRRRRAPAEAPQDEPPPAAPLETVQPL